MLAGDDSASSDRGQPSPKKTDRPVALPWLPVIAAVAEGVTSGVPPVPKHRALLGPSLG